MPKALYLSLEPHQRTTLTDMRDHHPRAYLRERAAALLKIADGVVGYQVAETGLLRRRRPETVYGWFHRYQQHGLGGLYVQPGRGRKPAFSPSVCDGGGGDGGGVACRAARAPDAGGGAGPLALGRPAPGV